MIWRPRYSVLAVLFAAYLLCYMDRMAIATALPFIAEEYRLSPLAAGSIMSAFFIGYAVMQIPGGLLVDRFGPNRVMTASIVGWSIFTALTGVASSLSMMLFLRVLFGFAEGPFPPSASKTVALWFPRQEVGTANGIQLSAVNLGAAVAPTLVSLLVVAWGWRSVFLCLLVPGLLMSLIVWKVVKDPFESVAAIELRAGNSSVTDRFVQLCTLPGVIWCAITVFFANLAAWGLMNWLPTYLLKARGFGVLKMGLFSSLPFLAGAAGYFLGGYLSDRQFNHRRQLPIVVGLVFGGVMTYLAAAAASGEWAVAALALAFFCMFIALAGLFTLPLVIAPPHGVGGVFGIVNTAGQVAAFSSPLIVGYVLTRSHNNFVWVLYGFVALFIAAALAATRIKSSVKTAVMTVSLLAVAHVSPVVYAAPALQVRAVSSRPDTVSGDDALIEVVAPENTQWSARLNGREVTALFRATEQPDACRALLTQLKLGKNRLSIRSGIATASIDLINHPSAGPNFTGPHQIPFICQTEANGLGPAIDANCTAATRVQYYYKLSHPPAVSWVDALNAVYAAAPGDLSPGFKVYDPSAPPSEAEIAPTVTSDGRRVSYIVRREIGTLNRAVYDIQFLHRPGEPLPTPWTRTRAGWNGRLVYVFSGGCGMGFHQGTLGAVGRDQEPLLAQGYAVATSTFNIFANSCNDRLAAETLSMVKEHFIEQYGEPIHTIGWGESGGAVQQNLIAQNFPGLLDGIVTPRTVPDITSGVAQRFTDCPLLDRAFKNSAVAWNDAEKTAVSGFATWRLCLKYRNRDLIDPKRCDASVPEDLIYDPTSRPKGARCDFYDNEINAFGRNSKTGFAYRPLDNVGVQYGLKAFNRGKIDAEQFLDLNERVGGYDADGHFIPERTEADPESIRIAYRRGLVLTGGGGLGDLPIIDWRWYDEDAIDGHDRLDSFMIRARLMASTGRADNQVILVDPRVDSLTFVDDPDSSLVLQRERELVSQMDRWLDGIAADRGVGVRADKIARNKPADLIEGCWATDGEKIAEHASYEGTGRCNQLYPPHENTRIAAGAPLANDVLKCPLKPISATDYVHPLSPDQLARLSALFRSGVCDYRHTGL